MVTGATGEHRQSFPFRTGHHHQRTVQVRFLQAEVAFTGQTNHPIPLLLEAVEGTVEVHHPGHGQVFQGAGGHLGHRTGQAGVAALGQHQAMGSQGLGTAHDRPQVLGIGQPVHSHQQGRLP